MSFVLLGILNSQAASGVGDYWLNVLGGAGSDGSRDIAAISGDDFFMTGYTDSVGSGGFDGLIAKYNANGQIQLQRVLGDSASQTFSSQVVDASENVYVVGNTGSFPSRSLMLAKYNSSGTLQWQRELGQSGDVTVSSVSVDSSGNIYIAGVSSPSGSPATGLLAKYNSSGTLQWQRELDDTDAVRLFGVNVDSSDNIYVAGSVEISGASDEALLAKYNSSGTLQWQRKLAASGAEQFSAIAFDSSDNVYVSGHTDSIGEGGRDFLLAKYNSSGTLQWQRILGGANNEQVSKLAVDSIDNFYIFGITLSEGEGSNDFLVAKYDSSGTIQWQRVLGGTASDFRGGIAVDSADNLLISGSTSSTGAGGNDALNAKIPNDGSLTGTYSLDGNNIVYAVSTLTAATGSLTAGTPSVTSSAASQTSSTSTFTDSAVTLTSVTEPIG